LADLRKQSIPFNMSGKPDEIDFTKCISTLRDIINHVHLTLSVIYLEMVEEKISYFKNLAAFKGELDTFLDDDADINDISAEQMDVLISSVNTFGEALNDVLTVAIKSGDNTTVDNISPSTIHLHTLVNSLYAFNTYFVAVSSLPPRYPH